MSIKGVGQDVAVQRGLPQLKIAKPQTEPQRYQAPIENKTRANENAFGSAVTKEALNRLFDKAEGQKTEPAEAPKPPIDYNEVDKQADELIKKHTSDGIFGSGIAKDLDEEALGRDLAEIAKTDPARAAALTDNVFDKIEDGDRNGLGQGFVNNLSADELRAFASDDKGKEVLNQLKDKISGPFWNNKQELKTRIETAIKAAELEKSPEFQKLGKSVQGEILLRLGNNEKNGKAVDNLIDLVKDRNFQNLSPASQKSLLGAYDNHKEDKIFVDGLKNLAGKTDFQALNQTQRDQVINDLDRFANSESYKGTGGLFGHDVSEADKAYLLDHIGDTAILSANDPANTAVRNTLDKIINDEVRIETYSEAAKNNRITFGTNNGNGVLRINTHPDANNDAAFGTNKFTDTIVHELNHQLNQGAEHGTPEQFLNEYRAFYVGLEASGTNSGCSNSERHY